MRKKNYEKNQKKLAGLLERKPNSISPSPETIAELAREQYQNFPEADIDGLLDVEEGDGQAFAELATLVGHYAGSFRPEQFDKIIAAIRIDDPQAYNQQRSMATSLGLRYGEQLSPEQINDLKSGIFETGLTRLPLAGIVSRHDWNWSENIDELLRASKYDPISRLAVIERCCKDMDSDQVNLVLGEASQDRARRQKDLETDIGLSHGSVDGYHLPLNREPRDWEKEMLLNRRCPDIRDILVGVIRNSEGKLQTAQIQEIADLGNSRVKAELIAVYGNTLEGELRQSIITAAEPGQILRLLEPERLPDEPWVEALLYRALDEIDFGYKSTDSDRYVDEKFTAHFQTEHIKDMAQQTGRTGILAKLMEYQPNKFDGEAISIVLDNYPGLFNIARIRSFGRTFTAEHVDKMLANCSSHLILKFSHAFPKRLPNSEDIKSKVDLVVEKCASVLGNEWIRQHHKHIDKGNIERILSENSDISSVLSLVKHCRDQFSEAQIDTVLKMADNNRQMLPELAVAFHGYCFEQFEQLPENMRRELAKHHPGKLTENQIDLLIEEAGLFGAYSLVKDCGQHFTPEQIEKCYVRFNNYRDDDLGLYSSVYVIENRDKVMLALIRQSSQKMTPQQIDRFIEEDDNGSYVLELLDNWRDLLSEQQKQRIVHRFGYIY